MTRECCDWAVDVEDEKGHIVWAVVCVSRRIQFPVWTRSVVLFESSRRIRHGAAASTSTVDTHEYTVFCDYDIRSNLLDFCLARLLCLAKTMGKAMAGRHYSMFRHRVGIGHLSFVRDIADLFHRHFPRSIRCFRTPVVNLMGRKTCILARVWNRPEQSVSGLLNQAFPLNKVLFTLRLHSPAC